MPRRRRHQRPLRFTLGERFGRAPVAPFALRPATLPAPPFRSVRDVLALLLAATGLSVAARADAAVELLPGSPTTIVITVAGKARATFVLPVSETEAAKFVGRPAPAPRDHVLEALWQESRAADLELPDAESDEGQDVAHAR